MRSRKWKVRAVSLLFVAVALFVFYKIGYSVWRGVDVSNNRGSAKILNKNEFSNVVYKSFDKDNNEIVLYSSKVKETSKQIFDFSDMVTTFQISPTEKATVFADETHFVSQDSKQCDLKGHVKLSTQNGLVINTEKSFIDIDKKIAKGNTDIVITQDDTKFFAKQYHFDMGRKIVTLTNSVSGNLNADLISADKLIVEFDKVIGKDFKKVCAFGNSNYKTSQYDLKAKQKIIYTKTNAEATQNVDLKFEKNKKKYHITSQYLKADFQGNSIKKVFARDNLKIKIDNTTQVKGNQGILEDDLLTVSGNAVISSEKGNILCEKAILNLKTNDIKIYKSKGIVKGR